MNFLILAAMLMAPLHGPDQVVLSRPLAGRPYTGLSGNSLSSHDYDIYKYDISIEVFPQDELLEAVTEVSFTSEVSGLSGIRLDLVDLVVDSVWNSSGELAFSQVADSLFVTLDEPLDPGDSGFVAVSYGGTPWNEGPGGFGGFWFSSYIFYHMGVGVYTDPPSLGRVIFPCWDHPSDKAAFQFHITVPDSFYAVANGDLVVKDENPSEATATYHWQQLQPMPTYLAAFSVCDYVVLQDSTYDWIHYYVYPSEVGDALGSFQNVDHMMDRYESVYSPYPWDTKFSYVQTPKGDMEHLTQVYHIAWAINGSTTYDWLLAHEMSHHWWGNCVTEEVWSDVWLSEGFAVYSEAVWAEYYGSSQYDSYVLNDIMIPYLNSGELFPLTDPTTPAEMWSYTTYQKGGSVLHMLRHVLGDDDFYDALQNYFNDFAYSSATTDDLRDHIESVTGEDIDWFFDCWMHGWGYPVYDLEYSWEQSGASWDVTVDLEQVQTTSTIFTMPLEFLIHGTSQDSLVVMLNDQAVQTETFTVPFEPVSVEFDPGNYVLSTHLLGTGEEPAPPLEGTGTLHFSPNPASLSTSLVWTGMDDAPLTLGLYDLSGRMLRKWELSESQRTVELMGIPAGVYLVEASGPGSVRQTAKLIVGR